MAITTTSGPGLSLKSEALGLAVITELPLILVNVQRGGPSTGLPTKTEQSDLYQALFGRNGEAPLVVMAASTSANCFLYAYMASKIAMEHMTPVILLTDGYLGNGSQLFRIPKVADLPDINPPVAEANDPDYKPYRRDPVTLARKWALPGTEGLRHRIGGLEKQEGDILVVSWGGTHGSVSEATEELHKAGQKVGHAHFHYIMPLPKNTEEIFKRFKKILVCELNSGQFVNYLRMKLPQFKYEKYNKVQGLPFTVSELVTAINSTMEEK